MPRKLLLTQKQITAICKGASRAGYLPIIEVEGVSVRLIPYADAQLLTNVNATHGLIHKSSTNLLEDQSTNVGGDIRIRF